MTRSNTILGRLLATDAGWGMLALRSNNGYEFALALLAVSVALVFSGAGRGSVDRALSQRLA